MTGYYRRRNGSRALLFTLVILVGGHFATQHSPTARSRTLPFLLLLVLGELVRELVIGWLAPTSGVEERRRRTRLAWSLLSMGLLLFALPVIAMEVGLDSGQSAWQVPLFGLGTVVAGVSSALLTALARDAIDARLAEARRTGSSEALDAPGPLMLVLIVIAAAGFFGAVNATVFGRLFDGAALTTVEWLRLVGTAVGIGSFAMYGWHRAQRQHEEMVDSVGLGDSPRP